MSKKLLWSVLAASVALIASRGTQAQITGELVNPNVLLVLDSSGSMDWLSDHPASANEAWAEAEAACLAQDANQRTSWQKLVDVMLGSIPADDYHCMVETPGYRPDLNPGTVQADIVNNISEYRESPRSHYRAVPCAAADWNADYQQCIGNVLDPAVGTPRGDIWCRDADWDIPNSICYDLHPLAQPRRTNGILDRYSSLVRFGLMTYDNKPAPAAPGIGALPDPHDGLWNFGDSRTWSCKEWYYGEQLAALDDYPTCVWNAGARTNDPDAVGRLVPIRDDMVASGLAVRDVLQTTEPLYCSPMGALLDDVGYYFHNDLDVRPSDEGGNDRYFWCRPKLVIFISDGQPTPAFEFPQDYCDHEGGAPPDPSAPIVPSDVYRCPWNSSNTEVEQLFNLVDPADADPILLVVIGFNVPEVPDCAATPDDCVITSTANDLMKPRDFLDQLALSGWPNVANVEPPPWRSPYPDNFNVGDDPEDNCPSAVCGSGKALFVETPEQLSAVLDMVLGALTVATVTRTEVASTDQTSGAIGLSGFSDKTVAQYEFNSGYLTAAGLPWKGLLYRQGFACQSESGPGGAVDDPDPLHEWLNSQATRTIYTLPTGLSAAGNTIPKQDDFPGSIKDSPEGLDVLEKIEDTGELTDCDFGGPLLPDTEPDRYQLCSASNDIQNEVAKHLYGATGSERRFHKLADIYNSTPSVLGPPMERLLLPSYQAFKSEPLPGEADKRMIERPPYLFVGTNDGVLHSINVWASGPGDDVETWGFVPTPLLETLRLQFPIEWTMNDDGAGNYISYTLGTTGQYQHIFGVDGAPVTTDVRLYRNAIGMDEQVETKLWRSIVMGSLGKGGRGYYCLDATNPKQKPTLRWEATPDSSANNPPGPPDNPEDATADPNNPQTFDAMGTSASRPALAYAFYEETIPGESAEPTETEVAVAILPGGYWNDADHGPETATGVYIVRVADGHLVRYLDPTVADDICRDPQAPAVAKHDPLVAQLVGEPTVPQRSRSTLIAKEAYLGDDRGRLWRVDMSGTDPDEDWCIEMYFDTLLTTHFPYQDCIEDECDLDPSEYSADDCYAVDCCTGIDGYCQDENYPFPRIPIINAPTIVQDEDRNNIIIFGTGQIDGLETLDHHRIFSITDRIIYDVAGQRTYHDDPEINWWIGEEIPATGMAADGGLEVEEQEQEMLDSWVWFADDGSDDYDFFNLGEKVLGRPVVFAETAYFTSFIPTDPQAPNACESGGSRIWAVHFANRDGEDGEWQDDIEENDFGRFGGGGADAGGEGFSPFIEYPNELLSAVRVIRRPSCTGETTFQLVAQRVNTTPGSGEPPPPGQPRIESISVPIEGSSVGFTTVAIDSWSLVFD